MTWNWFVFQIFKYLYILYNFNNINNNIQILFNNQQSLYYSNAQKPKTKWKTHSFQQQIFLATLVVFFKQNNIYTNTTTTKKSTCCLQIKKKRKINRKSQHVFKVSFVNVKIKTMTLISFYQSINLQTLKQCVQQNFIHFLRIPYNCFFLFYLFSNSFVYYCQLNKFNLFM